MKLATLITLICLSTFTAKAQTHMKDRYQIITPSLSVTQFEHIKSFILDRGDRRTYCNKYNQNPHYAFDEFDVYLNPDIGQRNINCDPEISDFNELVIHDSDSDPQYYTIHILKKGDAENEDIIAYPGMQENNTYLMNDDKDDLNAMLANVQDYLEVINAKVKL